MIAKSPSSPGRSNSTHICIFLKGSVTFTTRAAKLLVAELAWRFPTALIELPRPLRRAFWACLTVAFAKRLWGVRPVLLPVTFPVVVTEQICFVRAREFA